jgi:uncharacterized protein (DUF2336 family)
MSVLKYIAWLETASAQARAGAVAPLVRALFRPDVGAADRDVIDATLTTLLDDPSVEVRRALAEALARQEGAPRHLVVSLANDLPAVAEPVFRHSPCLLDAELVEALQGGSARVQIAIASRPWVSFAVSEAIASDGDIEAVLALAGNAGADLDEIAFRSMIARFPGDPELREALFAREDLPLAARQSLIAGLGARLTELMVSRDWVAPRRADAVVREACDRATVEIASDADDDDVHRLVEHLRATAQLTTALLIRSMCQGQVQFFEAALAILAEMPVDRVYAILSDGRHAALKALFRKAGLPDRSHPAFIAALDARRDIALDGEPGDRARYGRARSTTSWQC